MVCGICHQSGHNRRTCPQRNIQNSTTRNNNSRSTRRIRRRPVSGPNILVNDYRRNLIINRWKKSITIIKDLKKFMNRVNIFNLNSSSDKDVRIIYLSWLKIRGFLDYIKSLNPNYIQNIISQLANNTIENVQLLLICMQQACSSCYLYHIEINPIVNTPPPSGRRTIELINMRDTKFLIYWVIGNYLIQDLDEGENDIKYIGMINNHSKFNIMTLDGHRFYLIPNRLNREPSYHPKTDKEFIIEPYLQLNIHEGIKNNLFIDEKENLSELNKWKFNALKLDYLIREVIKLGGKNNDVLESVLDLYDDIQLDTVTESIKDLAGIPSEMTNIT